MRKLVGVFAVAVLVLAFVPPASADHGYQTFKFTNKTKKNVYDIHVVFTTPLSHIGDKEPTWAGLECTLSPKKTRIDCVSETRLSPGDSFKLSVATPPADDGSYVKAGIKGWGLTDKDHEPTGEWHSGCKQRKGCTNLGVQR